VVVWATRSVFIHVTVEPAAMLRLSGAKARLPSVSAPTGIATVDETPPGVGVGDGVLDGDEGDEYPPQAIADNMSAVTAMRRNDDINFLRNINSGTLDRAPFLRRRPPPRGFRSACVKS
jgi:hypothetical protein